MKGKTWSFGVAMTVVLESSNAILTFEDKVLGFEDPWLAVAKEEEKRCGD